MKSQNVFHVVDMMRVSRNLCRIFDALTVIRAPEPPYQNFRNADIAPGKLSVLKLGYGARAEYLGFSGDRYFFKAVPFWGPFRPRILKIRHKFLENLDLETCGGGYLCFFLKFGYRRSRIAAQHAVFAPKSTKKVSRGGPKPH